MIVRLKLPLCVLVAQAQFRTNAKSDRYTRKGIRTGSAIPRLDYDLTSALIRRDV